MPVTPCLGIGLGACPVLSPAVLCCAVLSWGCGGGEGPGRRAGRQDSPGRTPRSLLSCGLAILLLLVTFLTKLVFGFWDS